MKDNTVASNCEDSRHADKSHAGNSLGSPFWSDFFHRKKSRTELITDLWLATPLFQNIPPRVCRQLVQRMSPRQYQAGEKIFNAGELGAGAVLIKSGRVAVQSGGKVLTLLQAGDFFGEVALVYEGPRTADAIAETECELVFLVRQEIEEWVRSSPRYGAVFMSNIAQVLAGRLSRANELLSANDK